MTWTFLRALPVALLLAACRAGTPSASDPALTDRLAAQLRRSADDWNRGDLEGFMSDYAHDSATSFVEGGHVRRGWDFIHSRYAPSFAPGARRDSLRFEEVAVRPLGTGSRLAHRPLRALPRRSDDRERPVQPDPRAADRRLEDPPRSHLE